MGSTFLKGKGKKSELGRIMVVVQSEWCRLVVVQSEPRPHGTLWRALRLDGLSELFPSTVRKLGIFILTQAVSGYRQNLRRHPDLRQNSWGEHFLGRAASWGLGPSVLKGSGGRMQADIVFHVPLQA